MSNALDAEPAAAAAAEQPRSQRTIRNPLRRQRNDSDSIRTAPRRKRSKVTETHFVSRGDGEEDADDEVPAVHGRAVGSRGLRKGSLGPVDGELVLRGGRKFTAKRGTRGDGAQVLTENEIYTVKSLPSTPRELKRNGQEFRGSLATGTGQALAVTREQAIVWEYGSHAPVSNAKIFDVPFTVRDDEPLPFGALVTGAANADTGLLLISATTGQVVFHESIERAASMGLFQERRPGVVGTLGMLFTGEHVVQVTSADIAGFVVTLSSGRLAQLTLRDMQGKARIQAQILREDSQERSSWAATFKGLLGGSAWKVDVAAVRTRSSPDRGHMQAIALTEHGVFKSWDLKWSGNAAYQGSIDFREEFARELRAAQPAEMQGFVEPITVLDFALMDRPSEESQDVAISTTVTERPADLLILVRAGSTDMQQLFLVETTLSGKRSEVKQVISISPGSANTAKSAPPKLVLPKPCHTAYVVLENAIVLAATTVQVADPVAQFDVSYIMPESFKDVVYLRQNKSLVFMGAEVEDNRSGNATCIAFVQGAGLVRFSAKDADAKNLSSIPVKSKIEQAVFYGMLQDNILDLPKHDASTDGTEEVEEAALAISDEVLRSETRFIPETPTSIEANLTRRAQALNALAVHLRQHYPVLSRKTMWKLLWDAEKLAAGQELWKTFETHLTKANKVKRKSTVLHEIARMLQDMMRFEMPEDAGPDDRVRHMFVVGIARIERFLPWARQIVESVQQQGDKSTEDTLRLVSEANDIWINTFNAALNFRTENAQLYNIYPESMPKGILTDPADFQGVPEFWTSSDTILKDVLKTIGISREAAVQGYDESETQACAYYAGRLASDAPQLVQLTCHAFEERIAWVRSRGGQKFEDKANQITEVYHSERYAIIRALSSVGQSDEALRISENYRDMKTLTDVLVGESQYMEEQFGTATGNELEVITNRLEELKEKVGNYFDRFGDEWADAFFDEGFSGEQAGQVLYQGQKTWQPHLTKYLRAQPDRAKICWINDVTLMREFVPGSKALLHAATEQENNVWCKKVQLSMAKLSMLAAAETTPTIKASPDVDPRVCAIADRNLTIIDVQNRLYRHILPEILGVIDIQAEVAEAMRHFGQTAENTLFNILEYYVAKLLQHLALTIFELVDILTLMDRKKTSDPETDLHGEEAYLALVALNAAAPDLEPRKFETLLKTIWKRVYLSTDWAAINKGISKRSETDTNSWLSQSALFATLLAEKRSGLFDSGNEHVYVRVLKPSECFGAGCDAADFVGTAVEPDYVEPLAHENQVQDRKLEALVAGSRLNTFVEDCERLVQVRWESEMEEQAGKAGREREFERGIGMQNGHANGSANGSANGFGNGFGHGLGNGNGNGKVKTIKVEDDGDGDVLMA